MDVMGNQMKDVVEKLNKAHELESAAESTEGIILQILNKHYLSLVSYSNACWTRRERIRGLFCWEGCFWFLVR